jgi:hypothetical protein
VNRREFITLLGGAAEWPLAARAQPKVGSCPSGYSESGGFCAPMRRDALAAIPKGSGMGAEGCLLRGDASTALGVYS